MSLYKDPKSPIWYASITVGGRRIRRSTGTEDKTEAQRLHDQWRADLWDDHSSGERWADACNAWIDAAPRGQSDLYTIGSLELTADNPPLDEITAETIEDSLDGNSPSTWNRKKNLILAILNHAHAKGKMGEVPKIESRKAAPGRFRWLTQEEWQRLDAYLPDHLRPLARFAVFTGLRRANVLALRWDQVDMKRRVMWIHADQAKAKKPIGIPLSDDAMAVLMEQKGKSPEWVFPYSKYSKDKARRKETIGPMKEVGEAFGRALVRAGIDVYVAKDAAGRKVQRSRFRWHDLRHTWASWHVMGGTPLEVLKELGGWSSLDMVLRYAHLAPTHLASYANNARPYSLTEAAA